MNPYIRGMIDGISHKPVLIRQGFMTEGVKFGGTKDKPEIISWGNFAADLKALASVDVADHVDKSQMQRNELCAAYGFSGGSDVSKPFAFSQGTAIIPIHGSLMNRLPYSFSFATGYNFITNQLSAAMADPDVERIVYDVNSNGGVVTGCPECAQSIFQANASNGGKPSMAVVDANCYSAAYYLSSAADSITLTPSGGAGSIGVVMMHADVSKALEDFGVKITFVHAGDHKVDGNMFEPLSDDVKANFQASVDKTYDKFVGDVASFRPGLTEKAVRDTQARVYNADDALANGLVDAVQSPTDALKSLASINTDEDDNTMATAPENKPAVLTQADVDTAATAARTAERARMSGITGHAEAADRGKLANHLAMNTSMSVEDAGAVLAASAKETPVVAVKEPEQKQETNHFSNAMDKGKSPNVGAGNEGSGNDGKPTTAQRMLAAQAKATGRPLDAERK